MDYFNLLLLITGCSAMICVYSAWLLMGRRTSWRGKSGSAYSTLSRSDDSVDRSTSSSSSTSDSSSSNDAHSSTIGRSSRISSSSISNASNRHQKLKRMSSGDPKRRKDSPAKVAYQSNMNEETFCSADNGNRVNVTSRATCACSLPACRLKKKNRHCHHYSVERHIEPADRLIERQTSPQRKPASQLELQLAQPNLKQQPALERPVWRAVLCARCYRLLNAISPTFAHYERHCGCCGCQFGGQSAARCGHPGRSNRVELNCNRNAREAHCCYLNLQF